MAPQFSDWQIPKVLQVHHFDCHRMDLNNSPLATLPAGKSDQCFPVSIGQEWELHMCYLLFENS